MTSRPKAVKCAVGDRALFGGLVECYVLDDGRRVLSQRGIARALTTKKDAKNDAANPAALRKFLERLPEDFRPKSLRPEIEFDLPSGGVALGRESSDFVAICQSYVDGLIAGALHPKQAPLAQRAWLILKALSVVGLEAMIDEATGNTARPEDYYRRRFDQIIRESARDYEKIWPPSMVRAIAKLYGYEWSGGSHPRFMASINDFIYTMILPEGAYPALKDANKSPNTTCHHQHLVEDARRDLSLQFQIVELLATQSANPKQFFARMRAHYRKDPLQLGWYA
jgi:hypothetical protein